MDNELSINSGEGKKKRGRRKNGGVREYVLEKLQVKFLVDVSQEEKAKELIQELLIKANQKKYGREIVFKDLALLGLEKLTDKDLEKLKEQSLSEMERLQKMLDDHNQKTGKNLSLGEFLIKKIGMN